MSYSKILKDIKKYSHKRGENKAKKVLRSNYQEKPISVLNSLCDKYGSDKGSVSYVSEYYNWPPHTYCDYYSIIFENLRNSVSKVFECGIGTNNPDKISSMGVNGKPGASLRVWRDYFPNAMIYGADIDVEILFEEDRIKTGYIDQLNEFEIINYWEKVGEKNFDIMIDDGLHTFDAGVKLFEFSFDKLKDGGYYIIEDVSVGDIVKFKNYFKSKSYRAEYVLLNRDVSMIDNCLVVVRK